MDPVLNSFLGYQGRPEKEDWWILPSWLTPSEEGKQVAPLPKGGLVACLLSHSRPCPPYLVPSALPRPARQGEGCGPGLAALPASSLKRSAALTSSPLAC